MHIRKATVRDFLSIAALDRDAWKMNRHPDFIPDGEHAWRVWVEHALVFCADNDGDIAGAILAFPGITGIYCVHKVFVSSSCRGAGIGSALFAMLLKEIDKEGAEAFLTVDPENAAAIALYTKWGFTDKKYVSGYYRAEEDRLVLTRRPNR